MAMIDKAKCFVVYDCCKLVNGYNRSIICDLQREEYCVLPNVVYEILTKFNGNPLSAVYELYSELSTELDNCFQFLFDSEFIFLQDNESVSCFPQTTINPETLSLLENFIIDIDSSSNHNFPMIFESLSKFLLKVLQIRFFSPVDISQLTYLMEQINKTDIRTVELILPHNENISVNDCIQLISKQPKIINICIYGSSEADIIQEKQATIIFSNDTVSSPNDCGKISQNMFSCNQRLFGESLTYNTCLNKKASIDIDGFIRNCPCMKENYGHCYNTDLLKVFSSKKFQEYWNIKKDEINICKDCEFRHICTDCRCFIKDPTNIYSQPAKCTYNPYICKWQGQEGYIPVEECGTYSKETRFVPNHQKIKELTETIWNETE